MTVTAAAAIATLGLAATLSAPARAAFVPVAGGPTYNAATQTGYQAPLLPSVLGSTAGAGVAVGTVSKYAAGTMLGSRTFRWDATGAAPTELGSLGVDGNGLTYCYAYAVNTAGAVVGTAYKYADGSNLGIRAVRWDAGGTAATELGNIGTSGGGTGTYAYAITAAGAAVGTANKYTAQGTNIGLRAVRWDAGGTAATELDHLGTDATGDTHSEAYAVNAAGTAVGYAFKYADGASRGQRAVRWDAAGTAATELANLGVNATGVTDSLAYDVNGAGTAVGHADKYTAGGTTLGRRAVRWDAGGTAATELGNLGTDVGGLTATQAWKINAAGVTIGYATKYSGVSSRGNRAVRWDAGGTAATELGNLGTNSSGFTDSQARAINAVGIIVGYATKYTAGASKGSRAVLWAADGVAVDLNTLIDPAAGWVLTSAAGISDTNWVTGNGTFDPDGTAGPIAAYDRAFLLDASSAVPEPGALGLAGVAAAALLARSPRRRGAAIR